MSIEIVARFYFEEQDLNTTSDMFQRTINIFADKSGENIRLKIHGTNATIISSFPDGKNPTKLHHSFESAITKYYPLGCGAGELVVATPKDLKHFEK